MKTLIIAMNSKYIHSSLAPWYLKASCIGHRGEIKVLEFTINENQDALLRRIYHEKAQVVAFSCYIWNVSQVKTLAENLKKVSPDVKVIFGGPEVSYDSSEFMEQNYFIDFLIKGEGETVFQKLLEKLGEADCDVGNISGLVFRKSGQIIENPTNLKEQELDRIPSPYTEEMLEAIGNRISYFESSRGCPFSCSYCLSSTANGVRFFSLSRVKEDLKKLMNSKVRQVKFVDRTFNCNGDRAKEIFQFIIDEEKKNDKTMNFHFEIAADLFTDEIFEVLSKAKPGLFQFEIGLQTTNARTLELIQRKTDVDKIWSHVVRLKSMGNIHLHLDLIAGLPEEDINSFKNSFNEVYSLAPDQLQLGFLKMLKGCKIREEAARYEFVYRDAPPYEILKNSTLTFEEISHLKGIEEALDIFFNSGKFKISIEYMIGKFPKTPFEFYHELFVYMVTRGLYNKSFGGKELYGTLRDFFTLHCTLEEREVLNDCLALDYLAVDPSGHIPFDLQRPTCTGFKEQCFEFLKDRTNIEAYLPQFIGSSAKSIYKEVHFQVFEYDLLQGVAVQYPTKQKNVLLFDYTTKDRVSGRYTYFRVPVQCEFGV